MKPSILKRDTWNDSSLPWLEDQLQMAIVEALNKAEKAGLEFTWAADQNGMRTSKRQAIKAKMTGMRAGEADLRLYFKDGRIGHIELKTKNNYPSKVQKERHELLRSLGHDVRVVRASCPQDAVDQVLEIMDEWLS